IILLRILWFYHVSIALSIRLYQQAMVYFAHTSEVYDFYMNLLILSLYSNICMWFSMYILKGWMTRLHPVYWTKEVHATNGPIRKYPDRWHAKGQPLLTTLQI
ncbi:hypothetical protein ACJX0J_008588, partial [Zea mays]